MVEEANSSRDPLRSLAAGGLDPTAWMKSAELQAMASGREAWRYAKPYDPTPEYLRSTADSARDTKELLDALVQHAIDAEEREARMLRWTIAGVVLAGIAAVAGILAIIVTVLVS